MWRDKIKASSIHLAISLLIALASMAVVYLVWSPYPLYKATGITRIFLLMLGIDIVLGPLLTFIVYKKGKKTLKFDLVVIALLQMSALLYGLYNVYISRPAWIVYNVDRFDLVRVNEIDELDLDKADKKYQQVGITGPKFVSAIVPDDSESRNEALFDEVMEGIAPSQKPKLYAPIANVKDKMVDKSIALEVLKEHNPELEVDTVLKSYTNAQAYLPLKANAQDMVVLINKDNQQIIEIVNLRPW